MEVDGEVVAQVIAAHLPGGALLAAHVEHFAEQIAEDVAQVDRAGEAAAKTTGTASAHARVTEAVVCGAFVGIAEHLVGLAGFLELFFSGMVTRVAVGVIL